MKSTIPGGPSAGDFFVPGVAMSSKQSKTDLRPHEARDARQQFAAQIRAGRAVLGWSQTDLGERTGVTQRAIYRVENGATQPRQLTRLRIERAFGDAGIAFESSQSGGFTMSVRPVNGGRPSARPTLSRRRPEAG
jgi:transcriptional regulator with XRE-family HTH domain